MVTEEEPASQSDSAQAPTLYENPAAATKAIREYYHYWTSRLTEFSLQLSYALLAANWAVFGGVDKIKGSAFSQLSIALVVISLIANLLWAKVLGEKHCDRIKYAESDPTRWAREYRDTHGKDDPWPSTADIDETASSARSMRVWLPFLAGLSFLIAVVISFL